MERIVLRHLSGSKANQVEEFPLNHIKELTIGRDPSSIVKYDPDRDDLVGRQHARITQDASDPTQFTLSDLNSRNGTYLNRQRILGSARIMPGDVVQFGAGGPEFQFDVEPRPAGVVKSTRIGAEAGQPGQGTSGPPPTRSGADPQPFPGAPMQGAPIATGAPGGGYVVPPTGVPGQVGRATVERMVAQSKSDSRKYVFIMAGLLLVVLVAVAGGLIYYWRSHAPKPDNTLTPAQVSADFSKAVVWIEASWKLIDTQSGGQVYQRYDPFTSKNGNRVEVKYVPLYRQVQGGKYAPVLTLDSNNGHNAPIGMPAFGGSGFAITSDGFILTNRHVAANWYAPLENLPAGFVVETDTSGKTRVVGTLQQGPTDWIPAEAIKSPSLIGKVLEGRNDYLYVTFPDNKRRIPAQVAGVSDEHDVAMIKINLPEPIPSVHLFDNYESIKPGDPITVIGYPLPSQLAPVVARVAGRAGDLGPSDTAVFVPEPTVTTGVIARVIKVGNDPVNFFSLEGDEYQHTAATNPGNSGGPVFDQYGRVIAVHFSGFKSAQGANFAVPIKYGMDLMGTKEVKK